MEVFTATATMIAARRQDCILHLCFEWDMPECYSYVISSFEVDEQAHSTTTAGLT